MGEATREMTLEEWVEKLPEAHKARSEYAVLLARATAGAVSSPPPRGAGDLLMERLREGDDMVGAIVVYDGTGSESMTLHHAGVVELVAELNYRFPLAASAQVAPESTVPPPQFVEYTNNAQVVVLVDDKDMAEEVRRKGGEPDELLADWPIVGALVPADGGLPVELVRDPERGLVRLEEVANVVDTLSPDESLAEWVKSPKRRRRQRRINRLFELVGQGREALGR